MGVSLFLDVDGISGDSTDDEHKGEIEIQAYSWGASNARAGAGGAGGGVGKVSFKSINFVKMVDVASPSLARAAASGRRISQAVFSSRPQGQDDALETVLTFTDVTVSSYQMGSTNGAGRASESFTLSFDQFSSKYAHLSNGPISGSMSGTQGP